MAHSEVPSLERLLDGVRRYYDASRQAKRSDFRAGETYIPVAAQVNDADEIVSVLEAVLEDRWASGGATESLEAGLPARFGRSTRALLVNSGSSANLVAVSSLAAPMMRTLKMRPLQKGDEVITAAAAFPTTVNPIFQNGLVPVFIDVDPATFNADPERVMAARTPKTRAIILAHALGNPFRADTLAAWAEKEDLYLIEDCCDALGAEIETGPGIGVEAGMNPGAGQAPIRVGSFGHFATVSFYPAHHMTTGEGGAVLSRDARFRRVAESMRDWGRDCWCAPGRDNTCGKRFGHEMGELPRGYDHKYTYTNIGYNLKMGELQASIGMAQLGKVDGFIATRRRNWALLNEGVRSSPVLREHLQPVRPTPGTRPSWFGFPVLCGEAIDRNALCAFLEARKVGTRMVFSGNLIRQPAYRGAEYRVCGQLEASDRIMNQAFWVGVHPALDPPQISYMIEQLDAGVRAQLETLPR